jgi:ligand-binding sensor domain-containing protein/signal transduction histidine kinase
MWFGYVYTIQAQNTTSLKFYRIPTGISSNVVTSIIQDKKGFLWFGTINGLNKFDGYGYTIYQHNPADSLSLTTSLIDYIYESRNGDLWICTQSGGLSRFDTKTEKFTNYHAGTDNRHLTSEAVSGILEDEDGLLWIGVGNGINCLNPVTNTFVHYSSLQPSVNYEGDVVNGIFEDSLKNIWVITRTRGLARFDKKTKQFYYFSTENTDLKEDFIRSVRKSKIGNKYWIGYHTQGMSLISITNGVVKVEKHYASRKGDSNSLSGNTVLSLYEDKQGNLWAGTENEGLSILHPDNTFTNYKHDKSNEFSLAHNSVWDIFEDSFGNIWIGTYNQGVNVVYNQYYTKFEHVFEESYSDNSLVDNNVSGFWETEDGNIWITTDGGGISKWDKKHNHFTNYTSTKNTPYQLNSNAILSVFEDTKHRLWFPAWEKGITILNPATNEMLNYDGRAKNLSSRTQMSVMNGRDGKLYLTSWNHWLDVFSLEQDKVIWSKDLSKYDIDFVYKIIEDREENLWVGTGTGLLKIDKKNRHPEGNPVIFRYNPHKKNSLSNDVIRPIFEDKNGNIWIGTISGLNKYNPQTNDFTVFSKEHGLSNNHIKGITEDKLGNLWISTASGISVMNPVTNTFENFVKEDGLQGDEFSSFAIYTTRNGEILAGGTNGFNIINPTHIPRNPYKPKVFIKKLKIFNKDVEIGQKDSPLKYIPEYTREIILQPRQNIFTLEFVALNYTHPERNQYAFMMENFEKDWNYVGDKREATYTNLPPGTYIFRIKAANNDGLWNEEETTLKIIILPPWWRTWWFRISFLVAILLLFWSIFQWRVRNIKARNIRLEKMVEDKTREIQSFSEEIQAINEELQVINEELHQQKEEVIAKNQDLYEANKIITQQNEEINRQNEYLEEEIKSRTQKLVDYNQQLEQYAFITAHNLRAPVARILGLGQLLNLKNMTSQEKEICLEKLQFSTLELDQVIKDLNTILEIKKDTTQVLTDINIQEEFEKVKISLTQEIEASSAQIHENYSEIVKVRAIQPYVFSIFFNLLSNAIKYRHPDRTLKVEFKTILLNDGFCGIIFSDNGLGIDLTTQKDKVFNLYKRFHYHVEGKGMGLFLVKTQLDMMGGNITIESEVNKGTTFTIFLKYP